MLFCIGALNTAIRLLHPSYVTTVGAGDSSSPMSSSSSNSESSEEAPPALPPVDNNLHEDNSNASTAPARHGGIERWDEALNIIPPSGTSLNDRIQHYLMGRIITEQNRVTIEIVLFYQVGLIIRGREQMRKADIEKMAYSEYIRLVEEIPESWFANPGVKNQMKTKLYNAQSPVITGQQVWRKQLEWLTKMRNEYMTGLPGHLMLTDLPSGTNIRDAIVKFVVTLWKKEHPGQVEEDKTDDDYWYQDIPHNYFFHTRKLWALLAVLVHRESPDLHPTPSECAPGANRSQVRAGTQKRAAEERHDARIAALDNQDMEFKKAKLSATQGVVIRQQNDSVSAQLEMFRQNREPYIEVLGEEAYNNKLVSLLQNLPNPITGVHAPNGDGSGEVL